MLQCMTERLADANVVTEEMVKDIMNEVQTSLKDIREEAVRRNNGEEGDDNYDEYDKAFFNGDGRF